MEAIKIRGSAATLIAEFDLISRCIIGLSTVLFFARCGSLVGIGGDVCKRLAVVNHGSLRRVYFGLVIATSVEYVCTGCCRHKLGFVAHTCTTLRDTSDFVSTVYCVREIFFT